MIMKILMASSDLVETILKLVETLQDRLSLAPIIFFGVVGVWLFCVYIVAQTYSKASLTGSLGAIFTQFLIFGVENNLFECHETKKLLVFICLINCGLLIFVFVTFATKTFLYLLDNFNIIKHFFIHLFFYSVTLSILNKPIVFTGALSISEFFSWENILFSMCPICN